MNTQLIKYSNKKEEDTSELTSLEIGCTLIRMNKNEEENQKLLKIHYEIPGC